MPEGLNPIEAGKKLHEHGEAAQGQGREENGNGKSSARHSRIVQIGEAILLALVTITAAWAGYSAAKWGTESRIDIAQSSTLRNLATRDDLTAISLRNFDASTFNAWFIAFTLNNPQKEAIAVRRFRPEFLVAFNAWMATDPLHNPHAPPGPTYMPQYKLPAQTQANALDNQASAKFDAGNNAGLVSGQLCPDHGLPGRRAVPGGHRQLIPADRRALRPDRVRLRAADHLDRADRAAADPSGLSLYPRSRTFFTSSEVSRVTTAARVTGSRASSWSWMSCTVSSASSCFSRN